MSVNHPTAGAGPTAAARGRAVIAAVGATVALAIGVLLTETPDHGVLS